MLRNQGCSSLASCADVVLPFGAGADLFRVLERSGRFEQPSFGRCPLQWDASRCTRYHLVFLSFVGQVCRWTCSNFDMSRQSDVERPRPSEVAQSSISTRQYSLTIRHRLCPVANPVVDLVSSRLWKECRVKLMFRVQSSRIAQGTSKGPFPLPTSFLSRYR